MTLQQLEYIVAIAETGSLNKAAEQLYVSQPSLSSAVKELEKELGITVFHRSARGVSLTADGAELLPYARQVLTQYETLRDRFAAPGARKKKFGVSTQHYSFAVKAFVEMVKDFGTADMSSPSAKRARRRSSTTWPPCPARWACSTCPTSTGPC